jgi:putative addiction module component (TIGR02574 family)
LIFRPNREIEQSSHSDYRPIVRVSSKDTLSGKVFVVLMVLTRPKLRLRCAKQSETAKEQKSMRDGPLYSNVVRMIKEKIPELQKLSTADKFALAVELWDELSSNPDEIPVTEEQLNELDRRFEEYRQDPDKVVTWEDAKARILSGRR